MRACRPDTYGSGNTQSLSGRRPMVPPMAWNTLRPPAPRSCACSPMTSSVRIMVCLFLLAAESLIMETDGASQYRPEGRNNNEYYRPLPADFRATHHKRDGGYERPSAQCEETLVFALFCSRGRLVCGGGLGGRTPGHGGICCLL